MGELWFVGLGLGDERGLSSLAVETLRGCDRVFAEEYTASAPAGTQERLSRLIGHPVELLGRSALESETPILEALDRHARVALVVVGDPFAATTHVALRLAAEKAGHRWGYRPNASVLTAAAGFLGLMHYRFGRTVSLPLPAPGFEPHSPLVHIAANRAAGLHTLVLLDLRPEERRYLTASEALRILKERDVDGIVVPPGSSVAVAARLGREDAAGWFGTTEQLTGVDFGPPMHSLVVTAELHFEEAAALERYRVGGSRR
jgi:diphthine synthase